MNLYTAKYTNEIYSHGDSITELEYQELTITGRDQFTFWYNIDEE